jgi:uncharacterized protein (TIGR03382 family)
VGDEPGHAEQAVHNVCPAGATTFGIDVSSWQGSINWSSVAGAGVKYAFIRVSDGANYADSRFAANWSGAKAHGVRRGAYQFFRSNQDPVAQANVLISHMGTLVDGDLPPVVDVETTDGVSASTRASRLHQWLDRVHSVTGLTPIIYTGGYFWDDNVAANFSGYPLWHAGYTGGSCPSTVSSHWSRWSFWQYTSSGHVSGIAGNVDEDRFNGALAALDAMAKGGSAATPAPTGPSDDESEAIFGAAQFDSPGNADIDGDGQADVCARAAAGMVCSLSGGAAPLSLNLATTSFANAHGWEDMSNYATLRIGDVDGDGRADVCARANAGIVCLPSTGTAFGASFSGPAWSDAEGWDKPEYYSTIRVADVDGDGKADICARAAAGFRCHLSTGRGFGAAVTGSFFSDADGFTDPGKYGTIRMGDVDGDGKLDVCARTAAGVECHRFLGASWGPAIAGPAWSDAHGFGKRQYWSTLRLADLDGDGRADVCVRASDAVHCRLSTGDAFGADIVGPALSDAHGWADEDNYATLRFADVTGDGTADLCARANAGARCWPFEDGAFGAVIAGPAFFADAGGFTHEAEVRTFRVADVNGDGRGDLCARDSAGFSCFLATGTGFTTRVDGPRWSDAHGWGHLEYSGTFLMSGAAHLHVASTDDDVGAGAGTGTAAPPSGDDGTDNPDVADDVEQPTVMPQGAEGCASEGASSSSTLALLGALVFLRRRR